MHNSSGPFFGGGPWPPLPHPSALRYSHQDPTSLMAPHLGDNATSTLGGDDYATQQSHLNVSDSLAPMFPQNIATVATAVVLGIFILVTVMGNVFVIFAIATEKNLKGVANSLILSLACADLMVAILVMPLSALSEVTKQWVLGPEVCQLWTSCDVLCCTASILHLLAIAVDRHWAVTDLEYARRRPPNAIRALITAVWTGACVISLAPLFGWKDPDFDRRLREEHRCLVSQNVVYQVFATCTSFYIPLVFILLLYWNIFKQARKRIRRRPGNPALLITTTSEEDHQQEDHHNGVAHHQQQPPGRLLVLAKREKKHVKESTEAKRERKAAKTLMIITGVFVVCWLPFFVMALLMSVCGACEPSDHVFSVLLWLGYTNSLLNPVIYTVFSPDFRNAFRRMLCGRHHRTTQRH